MADIAPNKLRAGEGYSIPHYGRLAIGWERNDPQRTLEVETIERNTGDLAEGEPVVTSRLNAPAATPGDCTY